MINNIKVIIKISVVLFAIYSAGCGNLYSDKPSGLQGAQIIDAGIGDASSPRVAVDSDGNVTAIWNQYNNQTFTYNVYSNRYTSGNWGTPVTIDDGSGNITNGNPELAVDSSRLKRQCHCCLEPVRQCRCRKRSHICKYVYI